MLTDKEIRELPEAKTYDVWLAAQKKEDGITCRLDAIAFLQGFAGDISGGGGSVKKVTLNKSDTRVSYDSNDDGTGGIIIAFDAALRSRFNYDECVLAALMEYDAANDCYLDRKTNPYRIVPADDGENILSVVFLDVLAEIYTNGFKIILI